MLLHNDCITTNSKIEEDSTCNLFYVTYNSQNLNFELQPHEETLSERGNYTEYHLVPSAACVTISKILYFSSCNFIHRILVNMGGPPEAINILVFSTSVLHTIPTDVDKDLFLSHGSH